MLRSSLFFRLRRERARLESLHGSSSETTQLLAEKLGLPPDEIGPMLDRLDTRDLSLDAPIYSDDGATLGDSLASHDDAELAYDAEKLRHRVEAALQKALPEFDTWTVHCRGSPSLPIRSTGFRSPTSAESSESRANARGSWKPEPAPRSAVSSPMHTGSAPTGPQRPPELPWVGGSA
ncbi:MAG TPA: hypothetical protein VK540_24900 [Polyangiaceae bacterium]|nr:hypothetical protein [Polyangiaceae bacterium]